MADLIQPYILYQFKNATQLVALLDGLFAQAVIVSAENLINFLDIDNAKGSWLDQIGLYLNYQRPLLNEANIFGYDAVSTQYDSIYYYDTTGVPAGDKLYKILLKAYILKRNSRFTLEEIRTNIKTCLGVSRVQIVENDKKVAITCYSTMSLQYIISLLNGLDSRWFGLPTGVGVSSFNFVQL